jgi:SNF2 family DNA or RNA helicase
MLALGSLLQKLREANEEKIVVVSNFTSTLDIIEKHCKGNRYPFCRLDGLVSRWLERRVSIADSGSRFHSKTDQKERISIVNTFNRGPIKNNCECYSLRLGSARTS